MGLAPLIDDLRIGGSDHTHKTAHYSDLTAAPSSRNSGGRLQSITGANAMAELIARIKALLRCPGGVLGMTLEASNVRLDTVGRELTIGGIRCTSSTALCTVRTLKQSIEKARSKDLSANGKAWASACWKLIFGSELRTRSSGLSNQCQ